jgi:hypothetical protein
VTPGPGLSPGKAIFCGAAAVIMCLQLGCSDVTNNACFDAPGTLTADGKVVDMGGTVTYETGLDAPDCYPGIEGSAGRSRALGKSHPSD